MQLQHFINSFTQQNPQPLLPAPSVTPAPPPALVIPPATASPHLMRAVAGGWPCNPLTACQSWTRSNQSCSRKPASLLPRPRRRTKIFRGTRNSTSTQSRTSSSRPSQPLPHPQGRLEDAAPRGRPELLYLVPRFSNRFLPSRLLPLVSIC